MEKIKIIKNRSDIGAGTRGSDLGIDAIEIAAINIDSDYFNRYEYIDLETENEVVYEKQKAPFAKRISKVLNVCTRLSEAVKASLSSNQFPLVLSGDHSSALGTISGIKTAFRNLVHNNVSKNAGFVEENLEDLCASLQMTLVAIVMAKIELATEEVNIQRIAIGGGVAANSEIRTVLESKALENQWEVFLPQLEFTTDNAAMIGIVGYYKYKSKEFGSLNHTVSARLPF